MIKAEVIAVRATKDDRTLIEKLSAKLGVGTSQIIRMGLRALAKNHKVTLSA